LEQQQKDLATDYNRKNDIHSLAAVNSTMPMSINKLFTWISFIACVTCTIDAFALVPSSRNKLLHGKFASSSKLQFGLPSWFTTPESVNDDNEKKLSSNQAQVPDAKIGWSGVIQLITAGLGAPFLGDYQGMDEETGKFMFSLEANNLFDEDGNSKQTSMPYFESGWVDPEDEQRATGNKGFNLFPWQKK
jgi:hypothetical protein